MSKQGKNLDLLDQVKDYLENDHELPAKYKEHILVGNYKGKYECHLKPDWLLIWVKDEKNKIITLVRTGSHSDLFK
jgi:mRNA interferase YafQ